MEITMKDIIEKHIADGIKEYRENHPNDNKTDEELTPYAVSRLLNMDWANAKYPVWNH